MVRNKKSFDFGTGTKPAKPKQSLGLLSKAEKEPVGIEEIALDFNKKIVDEFINLFGEKWRYRTIKEAEELCQMKISQLQLKRLVEGKFVNEQTLFALLLVIAKHKQKSIIEISGTRIEIV